MIAAAGLAFLVLLGQPQRPTYTWRDEAGQMHITNTPPPPGAELVEPPPPPGVEPAARVQPVKRSGLRDERQQVVLSPAQQAAWQNLDGHLAKARAGNDRRTLLAVVDSLVHDCLWGNGLWAMPALPIVSVVLGGLLGWWLALGLRGRLRLPLVGGFILAGAAFGHLLLNAFLYSPQAWRLRQNLQLLERHLGTGQPPRPERQALLRERYRALDLAADPFRAPWRFPAEVAALHETMKQVMVDP